jgi:hypothetical protein
MPGFWQSGRPPHHLDVGLSGRLHDRQVESYRQPSRQASSTQVPDNTRPSHIASAFQLRMGACVGHGM